MRLSKGAATSCAVLGIGIGLYQGMVLKDWDGYLHAGEDAAALLLLSVCPPAAVTLGVLNAVGATDWLIKELIQLFPNQ